MPNQVTGLEVPKVFCTEAGPRFVKLRDPSEEHRLEEKESIKRF